MTRRILKFEITPGTTSIETGDDPRFLAVGTQGTKVVAWCEATPGTGVQTLLGAVMTGDVPPDDGEYIGTTQVGEIVVHAYRQVPR